MRKGTKKNIIHGILIIIMIIFALMASLVAAFRDITVQSMVARSFAGKLSEKLQTDVKIRTFYITENLGLCIEDLVFDDLNGYPMFQIGRIDAKISPMILFGNIVVKEIFFKDVLGRVVKYENDEKLNVKEILNQLGGEKSKVNDKNGSRFHLEVEKLKLDNGHFIFWNQNKDKPEKLTMDYAHLDIDSIYGVFSNLEIRGDTVLGLVHSLRGADKCGLVLKEAKGDVLFCEKSLDVKNLLLETGDSHANLDLRFEYNNSSAYYNFIDSVKIIGDVRPSTVKLSDLKYFSWILDKMPDKFDFTAYYEGTVSDFKVSDFVANFGEESHIEADVSFAGLPDFFGSYIDVTINGLVSSYNDTRNFYIPIEHGTVPVPEMFECVETYTLSGCYQGYAKNFKTQFSLFTEVGDINVGAYLNTGEAPSYSFDIDAQGLKLNTLLASDYLGEASFDFDMNGRGLELKDIDFEADLFFSSLVLNGNEFNDLNIHGDFENQRFITMTDVRHPYLDLDLSSIVDFHGERLSYNIIADINDADLVKLNFLDNDSIMHISSNINAEFSGDDIDNLIGRVDVKKTRYFNGEEYLMDNFGATVTESSGIKDVTINCDFFDFYGTGIVNAKTFVNAMKNTAKRYVNMPKWFDDTKPDDDKQEFSLSMNLKDTRTLSKLFAPSLYVSGGTTINASYTDGYSYHGSTIDSPEIVFNGMIFKNIEIRNNAKFDEFVSVISLEDIIFRDSTSANSDRINLENIVLSGRFGNDRIDIDLQWDDDSEKDHNKAHIKSVFTPHEQSGGVFSIKSDFIRINDTIWHINPDCNLDFRDKKAYLNDFDLYTQSQKIAIHGVYPKYDSDSLFVEFDNVDVSDFDFITSGNNLDFDGLLNGFVGISGLSENLSFASDIDLRRLYINGQAVGDMFLNTKWYEPSESIFLNMEVYNQHLGDENHKTVGVVGFYYPNKKVDNLKFDMLFDDFKLETMSPFIRDVVSRTGGYANGNLKVRGSVDAPEIIGKVKFSNAACKVNYLNTYYTFSDTVAFAKNKIIFNDVVINDTLGNKALLNGSINHNYLKDINFDLTIQCSDFLAFDIPHEKAEGFYGTAVSDGTVKIKGPVDDVVMTIDAVTKKGTEIDVPLSGTSSVENNFVVFVQNTQETDTVEEKVVNDIVKKKRKFTMNLDAAVNSDAAVNIYLPQNMGNINARGSGNINIGLNSNDFELRGDYYITSGSFNFTLQMVKRLFTLRQGGTLRWTGDPADADIDVVGVYRTKSSLTSLGTPLVDSTAITNNINVDCIIRLSDKLMNPTITFGIELPNALEDIRSLVYSVIDTTNQAVMAQQVFSLMVLGSFSYTAGNNIARFGTTAGYSVITSQLSNWLSQISKDFDIGINYTPNDNLTNEELEVALSTQLFDDRLIVEGNFGVIRGNETDVDNANNIVGDVDLTFRLTKRLSLKAYNHTNIKNNYYYYSIENYSDFTQGVGISYSQSFDSLSEVFNIHRKNKKKKNTDEPTSR